MAAETITIRVPHGETVTIEGRVKTLEAETVKVTVENHRQGDGPVVPVVTLEIQRKGEF